MILPEILTRFLEWFNICPQLNKPLIRWQLEVWELANSKGWRDGQPPLIDPESGERNIPWIMTKLALITSEVGEAINEVRTENWPAFNEELADVMIRMLDLCQELNIDIEEEMVKKHEKNKGRAYRHGGKKV